MDGAGNSARAGGSITSTSSDSSECESSAPGSSASLNVTPQAELAALMRELELYNPELIDKPAVVFLNKSDLFPTDDGGVDTITNRNRNRNTDTETDTYIDIDTCIDKGSAPDNYNSQPYGQEYEVSEYDPSTGQVHHPQPPSAESKVKYARAFAAERGLDRLWDSAVSLCLCHVYVMSMSCLCLNVQEVN